MIDLINNPYILLLLGLIILVLGGEILVRNASGLALKAKIAPLTVGLTVVAIGTSTPELFASMQAAWSGSAGIAVGNVVGSNIANLGLALGLTAIVRPFSVDKALLKLDWPLLMLITVLFGALALDGVYSRVDGVILLSGVAVYMFLQLARNRRIKRLANDQGQTAIKDSDDLTEFKSIAIRGYAELVFYIIIGCVLLYYGADYFIGGASTLALNLGVREHIIGVTVVAFGTSVPEIVASLTAALKGQSELSIGNLIGSNVMTILLVLGASSVVSDISVDTELLAWDFWWMLGTTALLYPILTIGKKVSRIHGAIYLVCYIVYVWLALG